MSFSEQSNNTIKRVQRSSHFVCECWSKDYFTCSGLAFKKNRNACGMWLK